MRRHAIPVLAVAVAAVLAVAADLIGSVIVPAPALAAPAVTQKKSLAIHRSALVNGVELQPGRYRVELAPSLDTVTFLEAGAAKKGAVLVSVPCRVSMIPRAAGGDTVHYRLREDGREEITRIVFAGSTLSIDIGEAVKGPPVAVSTTER